MTATENTQIEKCRNHDHFWIEDGVLYESYNTIRGLRYRTVMEVDGMPDDDNLSDAGIRYIAANYLT